MFFGDWFGLIRVLVVGVIIYVTLIVFLRISGKRTLSKWNAFDFIVTIALGSTLSSALLTRDVSLVQASAALLLLIALQFIITRLSIRFAWFDRAVKASPEMLVERGDMCRDSMKQNRVTETEVLAAIRSSGVGSMAAVRALVFETDGSFSVITEEKAGDMSSAADVGKPYRTRYEASRR